MADAKGVIEHCLSLITSYSGSVALRVTPNVHAEQFAEANKLDASVAGWCSLHWFDTDTRRSICVGGVLLCPAFREVTSDRT